MYEQDTEVYVHILSSKHLHLLSGITQWIQMHENKKDWYINFLKPSH